MNHLQTIASYQLIPLLIALSLRKEWCYDSIEKSRY